MIADKSTFDAYFGKAITDKNLAAALNGQLYSYIVSKVNIPAENIYKACELYYLLASEPSLLDKLVVKVSTAIAAKKYDEIKSTFDGRFIGFSYTPNQMRKVQNIFFNIPEVTDVDKARFLRDYKSFLESQIKGVVPAVMMVM